MVKILGNRTRFCKPFQFESNPAWGYADSLEKWVDIRDFWLPDRNRQNLPSECLDIYAASSLKGLDWIPKPLWHLQHFRKPGIRVFSGVWRKITLRDI